MSPPNVGMLRFFIDISKENQARRIVCPWCNGISHNKYGKYKRYSFTSDKLITIQRYHCKHDNCRRTFSILPHPLLRITRFSLCLFQALLDLYCQGIPVQRIAKILGISWGAVARAITKAAAVLSWVRQEATADAYWAPTPCVDPLRYWAPFIRMFAAKFYPKRYGHMAPTENVNC